MSALLKCLKPDCMRKVPEGVVYCCEPCQIADTPPDRYELDPYDPSAYWTFVHSKFCEERAAERGECTVLEAAVLTQRPIGAAGWAPAARSRA